MPADPPATPDRFDEAVRAWRKRVPVGADEFRALTAAERRHAFTVAGVAEARVVQQVFDAVDRAVEKGTTLSDFKAEIGAELADAWGGEDAARIESLFRTNVMGAYNEGRAEIFGDPEVRRARPYLRYDASGDSRMCEICAPLDGTVMAADDQFWRTHLPPLHPGCRCIHVPLSAEEAQDEGVDWEPPEAEPPAPGFGTSSDYDPDMSSFSPEVAAVLREILERGE